MAINKNAIIRYQALDRCFRNIGRKYFIDDLLDACNEALLDVNPNSSGIRRSQLYKDIDFMCDSRGFDAPIERIKEGRKKYLRYNDSNFSINNQPLKEHEAIQLKETLITLSRFSGIPKLKWLEEMVVRLKQDFNLEKDNSHIISFDENPYLTGINFFDEIYNAIIYKKVLKITYKPFHKDEMVELIHPYFLKQYNNRWFLFGLDNDNQDGVVNKPLDRIVSIEESSFEYIPNTEIDFEEYFEDVVGVSVDSNKPIEKVILRVDEELLPYITTKPLHGSQIQHKDDPTKIELNLIPNYEFKALILSRGECIEVLEPAELREVMKQRAEKLYNRYK